VRRAAEAAKTATGIGLAVAGVLLWGIGVAPLPGVLMLAGGAVLLTVR
jgi:hypothetical protein